MPSTDVLLSAQGLTKSFGETRALVDVSLDIVPGRVHTVLGENGSGKSTLVKLLSGVVVPDAGAMVFNGTSLRRFSPAAMIEAGIVAVFQEVLIAPNRTVLDNILLGTDGLFSFALKGAARRSLAAAALANVTDRPIDLDQMAGDLPLPFQHLVVIARGFARRPRLLILDEPTAALDLADRDALFAAIRRATKTGCAVIFVSHRMPEILDLSDIVFVLRSGELVATVPKPEISAETLLGHLIPADEALV